MSKKMIDNEDDDTKSDEFYLYAGMAVCIVGFFVVIATITGTYYLL